MHNCIFGRARLHEILVLIASDKDPRFILSFLKSLHVTIGTKLFFSTTFYPQTDGQSEREIQILEDLLYACVIDFHGSWESKLPLVEFTYNNIFQSYTVWLLMRHVWEKV